MHSSEQFVQRVEMIFTSTEVVMFLVQIVCLFGFTQDCIKTTSPILMKVGGRVQHGSRKTILHFGMTRDVARYANLGLAEVSTQQCHAS